MNDKNSSIKWQECPCNYIAKLIVSST